MSPEEQEEHLLRMCKASCVGVNDRHPLLTVPRTHAQVADLSADGTLTHAQWVSVVVNLQQVSSPRNPCGHSARLRGPLAGA